MSCVPILGGLNTTINHPIIGCGAGSLAGLPWVSPSPEQATSKLSEGAQKTSSPASCGQDKGFSSEPEQANSPIPGATSPHAGPAHFELPPAPENPMDLQITLATPELAPLLHIGTQPPLMKISGRPLPSRDGDPSAANKRTAPSVTVAFGEVAQ